MNIEALKPKQKIVYEGRRYTVSSVQEHVSKVDWNKRPTVYVETTVGTVISGPVGTFVEAG